VWDAIRLEQEGIPTVVVVHDVFEEAARRQAASGGIPDLRMIVFPQPPPQEDDDHARASAEVVARSLEKAVGGEPASGAAASQGP
jgi:hypothetical protein